MHCKSFDTEVYTGSEEVTDFYVAYIKCFAHTSKYRRRKGEGRDRVGVRGVGGGTKTGTNKVLVLVSALVKSVKFEGFLPRLSGQALRKVRAKSLEKTCDRLSAYVISPSCTSTPIREEPGPTACADRQV